MIKPRRPRQIFRTMNSDKVYFYREYIELATLK